MSAALTAVEDRPRARPARISGEAGYAAPARHPAFAAAPTVSGPRLPPYRGETYYERPALKPSLYGWKVALYLWLGGLGGGAQLLATLADMIAPGERRAAVRRGRQIALGASASGAALLIADLHTPQRFFNMLRIFRKTSGMSIGTYVLMSFSLSSALVALGQWRADRTGKESRLARAAQIPAALAGAGMTTYTAALLAGTSTPLWAVSPCLLGVRFAASSIATAAAALSLVAEERARSGAHPFERLAMRAAAVELAASAAADARSARKAVGGPLRDPTWGPVHLIGVQGVGLALPVALLASGRKQRSKRRAVVAALAILGGGLLMRATVLHAGNRSAERPRDAFRMAQPRMIPENRDPASRALAVQGS